MRSTTVRLAAAVVVAASIVAAILTSHFAFVVLAVAALGVLATSFSAAGGLVPALEPFTRHAVSVSVWGSPVPAPPGATIRITSARALAAGLHLYLQIDETDHVMHLKVAQPAKIEVTSDEVVIRSAAYVQLSDRRLPHVRGTSALTVRRV